MALTERQEARGELQRETMDVLQEEAQQSVTGFAGAEAGVQRQGAAAQTPRQVELVLGAWGGLS